MKLFKELARRNKFLPYFAVSLAVFLFAFVVVMGIFVVYGLIMGKVDVIWDFLGGYMFSDFGRMIYFTLTETPYDSNGFSTVYLPLNFVLLYPFALFLKGNPALSMFDYSYKTEAELEECNKLLVGEWQYWAAIILYFAVHLTLIAFVLFKMRKWESVSSYALALSAIMMSGLMVVGIIRGTNVFQSLLFVLVFLWLYNHPNKYLRELSLVALAIAGITRLYPFLFGALLLKQKRIFESARVALYALVLAILPFFIYGDIIAAIKFYFYGLTDFVVGEGRVGTMFNFSVFSMFQYVFSLVGLGGSVIAKVVGYIGLLFTIVSSVYVGIFGKTRFSCTVAICCGIMLIPGVTFYYVSMFLIIPILYLIDEWQEIGKKRLRYYAVLFTIFALLPLAVIVWYLPQVIMLLTALVIETCVLTKSLIAKKAAKDLN